MNIAVAQFEPKLDRIEENLERTVTFIDDDARGADVVVLPELCLTGYYFRDQSHLRSQAEKIGDSYSVRQWSKIAKLRKTSIIAGIAELDHGKIYNSAVVINSDGSLEGVYRKIHLHHVEWNLFEPGNLAFPVFELDFGRVGVLVCYDLRFIEASRVLMLRGVDILCVPTTWSDLYKPRAFDEHGWCIQARVAVATAYLNRYYVACAGRIGGENDVRYLGSSLIVDPMGEVIRGPAPIDQEMVLSADVELKKARDKTLGAGDLVRQRRSNLYRELIVE